MRDVLAIENRKRTAVVSVIIRKMIHTLHGRNGAKVIAESLARVIAAIRITSRD